MCWVLVCNAVAVSCKLTLAANQTAATNCNLMQVEVLGLVLSNPAPPEVLSGTLDATGKIVSRATLVVVAVSLVGQWCAEASNKLSGGLKMYPYHGQNR
jgi:hypothetical protein